jgi:hypothetical protein
MTKTCPDCKAEVLSTSQPNRMDNLIDRLRNPLWVHSPVAFDSPQLEEEENIAAMNEAADKLATLAVTPADDAVTFIRIVGEELVNAGMPAGDRSVILANIRSLVATHATPAVGGGALTLTDITIHNNEVAQALAATSAVGGEAWECGAKKQGTAAGNPVDCDWPMCGCDPNAVAVLAALEDQGVSLENAARPASPLRGRAPPIEPTEEMVRAAYKDQPNAINVGFAQAYRVMVAASPPEQPATPAVGGEVDELIGMLECLSEMLTKENTGSDAGFDNVCRRAAQILRAQPASPLPRLRPVAFRVQRANADGLTLSKTEWRYFTDEAEARTEADALMAEYQGLYVRDGSAPPEQPAADPVTRITDEMVLAGAKAANPFAWDKGECTLEHSARQAMLDEIRQILSAALSTANKETQA